MQITSSDLIMTNSFPKYILKKFTPSVSTYKFAHNFNTCISS